MGVALVTLCSVLCSTVVQDEEIVQDCGRGVLACMPVLLLLFAVRVLRRLPELKCTAAPLE